MFRILACGENICSLPRSSELGALCVANANRCTFVHTVQSESRSKKTDTLLGVCFFGAATRIRTGDLILTKDVLYQLSHSSIIGNPCDADYYIKYFWLCQ